MTIGLQLATGMVALTVASAVAVGAQDKAAEVLQQTQHALGGTTLRSITALGVEGPFRRDMGGRQMEGTLALTIELPGNMHRSEDIDLPGGMSIERISVLAGDTSWEDTRHRGGLGGGMQVVLRSPEGRDLNPELVEQARLARLRSQLTVYMLAFFGGLNQDATYVAVSESPDGRADVLEVKDARGQAVRLFVDQQTHLPLMIQYNEVRPRATAMGGPGGGRGRGAQGQGAPVVGRGRGVDPEELRRRMESMPPPEPSLVTLYLSDFENVDGVLLPHRLVQAVDGQTVEEWTVRRARLNPPIKASVFEQKIAVKSALRLLLRTVVPALVVIGLSQDATAEGPAQLRVTVYDETQAVIVHAIVTVIDHDGVEYQALVNTATGVAEFAGLTPDVYEVRVEAEGFQGYTVPVTIQRGQNRAVATLPVAFREDLVVRESVDSLRDHGFTRTLTREEIDALSDDPDEMAEQLRQMGGPGAQIFIDGFRGGRLPPKDQIQQIRFRTNSFSAEYHDARMVGIDITTRPGIGSWRGAFNTGFRDRSLNARNAFAPTRGPEQQKRFMVSFQGPLVQGRTGLSVAADGNLSYDSQTIVAETPLGRVNEQVRRPVDGLNVSVRLEHAISATNSLRAEYARRDQSQRNLGVGDFDLSDRAFDRDAVTDTLRVRSTRTVGRRAFNELRVELSRATTTQSSVSDATTIRVLDAFTSGSAGLGGVTEGRQLTIAQNLDFTIGKHALRAGALVESGWWDSTQQSNANGTYTFSSLADFLAGRPRTYQRRVGDPLVRYWHVQAGWYIQDDFRLTKNLNLSLGLRQEVQTHVDDTWNLAPRGAFAWSWGKATVRGGYGTFYDWLEANIYEQTVRVDGTRQIDEIIIDPAYRDPGELTGTRLPASRIELGPDLSQPTIHQASIGYERPLASWLGFRTDYMLTRATSTWRSINVNAPIDGLRPDPSVGNMTQIQSTGRRDSDRVTAAISLRAPSRSLMGNVMYQWSNTRTFADSPLALPSDSTNPDVDWAPSGMDVRHRLTFMLNTPVRFGLRAGIQAQYSSALPYTITTGLDDNGDTVFNDRPAGVGRNSARGADQWNVNLRVTRAFNLGGLIGTGEGPITIGAPGPPPSERGQIGGAGGMTGGAMMGGGPPVRYRLDLYVQAFNLLNRTNFNSFVGNQLSPYFRRPTSAAPPRRLELGVSLNF